ncbi:hypothetical protein J1N35_034082, partial [Gossypium stocksii]
PSFTIGCDHFSVICTKISELDANSSNLPDKNAQENDLSSWNYDQNLNTLPSVTSLLNIPTVECALGYNSSC